MNDSLDYTVVVPVFNSKKTLNELFHRIKTTIDTMGKSFEVIFVEDCGQDESWKTICQLKSQFPAHIVAIKLSRNFGQHNAIMCGFDHARGNFIITIDDDLQIPPEEIRKIVDVQQLNNSDLVYGVYEKKQHHTMRNLGSQIIQKIFQCVFKTTGDITSFRLISSSLVAKIKQHRQNFVFVDGLLHWYTSQVDRVEIGHEPRRGGKSGYSAAKLIRLATNLLFNFTTLPLRIVVYLGLLISVTSFLIGALFVFRKVIYDVPVGYTSIIVTLFFMSGIILLVMGVIGEYLSRLFSLQNNKPQYSIKELI